MSISEILSGLGISPVGGLVAFLFFLASFIEVSKIKINPWSSVFSWIGKKLNQSTNQRLDTIEKNSNKMQTDLSNHIVQSQRRIILDFADGLRVRNEHSKEQFDYVLSIYGEYETYIEQNGIKNGQVNEAIKYIREIYQERLHENDFL